MRVISQDGTIDVPYDYFSLATASEKHKTLEVASIYCRNFSSDSGAKLAEYSSVEKAIKAIKMLTETQKMESVEFEDRIYHRNTVFQFPQDDEIEV